MCDGGDLSQRLAHAHACTCLQAKIALAFSLVDFDFCLRQRSTQSGINQPGTNSQLHFNADPASPHFIRRVPPTPHMQTLTNTHTTQPARSLHAGDPPAVLGGPHRTPPRALTHCRPPTARQHRYCFPMYLPCFKSHSGSLPMSLLPVLRNGPGTRAVAWFGRCGRGGQCRSVAQGRGRQQRQRQRQRQRGGEGGVVGSRSGRRFHSYACRCTLQAEAVVGYTQDAPLCTCEPVRGSSESIMRSV